MQAAIDYLATHQGEKLPDDIALLADEEIEVQLPLVQELPFGFGIDDNGNYGYYKKDSEILTPFAEGGGSAIKVDSELSAISENPVQNKIITAKLNEVFQSVSDGKNKIAAAITDKGINTAADATFNTMSENIKKIETGSSIQKDNTKISYNKVILNAIECTVEVIKNVD